MAKQLLLNTLVDVFGEYLTGLTAENLQIGVWSGEIKYDDLRVNPAGISKLGLPVDVAHGSIRHFAVSVPWTRLESQPVTVDIDGVYVVARPVDRARLSDDELHRRFIQNKQDAIASALKAAISAAEKGPGGAESKTEEGSGYFARLQRTIVDNIQINVRRVHVRYENATASLGKTLAIGVALEEFKVSSATADFSEAFVQRDARDPVQKVVKLGNLSVYVDGDAEPFGGMAGSPAVEAALEGAILTREAAARLSGSAGTAGAGAGAAEPGFIGALNLAESPRLRSYVLAPFSGEVCFSQVPPGTAANTLTAAMTADVIMDELSVHVSAAQFRALYAVQEEMERLQLFYDMMPHRPTERPTAAPRAWWRYAYRCITHRPNVVSWDDVLRNLSLRKSYVELYTSIAEASEGDAARADELKRDLFEMEGLLPVPTILLFRRRAEQVLARRRRERELEAQRKEGADAAAAAAEEEKPRALSFFQRMGSFMKKEAPKKKAAPATLSSELGDIDLGTLAASVSGPDAEAPSRPDGITMVACFNASASVQLSTVDFAPIVRFDVSVGGALEMRAGGDAAGSYFVEDVELSNWLPRDRRRFATLLSTCGSGGGAEGRGAALGAMGDSSRRRLIGHGAGRARRRLHVSTPVAQLDDLLAQDREAVFRVHFTRDAASSTNRLGVTSRPVRVHYDRACLELLAASFKPRASDLHAMQHAAGASARRAQEAAGRALAESTEAFELRIDSAAPMIYVPAADRDAVLLLDAGAIGMTGRFASGASTIDLSLTKIEALLVPQLAEGDGAAAERGLILPFDIGLSVAAGADDSALADGVDTRIRFRATELVGVMEPQYILDLLSVVDYASGAPPGGQPAATAAAGAGLEESVQLHLFDEANPSSVAVAEELVSGTDARPEAAAAMPPVEEADALTTKRPLRVELDVEATVQAVSMRLFADGAVGESGAAAGRPLFTLLLDTLSVTYRQRAFDRSVKARFGSIFLEDHALEAAEDSTFKYLIETGLAAKEGAAGRQLVVVDYLQCTGEASPDFHGAATVVDATFADLRFGLTEASIRSLRPFAAVLLGTDGSSGGQAPPQERAATAEDARGAAAEGPPARAAGGGGGGGEGGSGGAGFDAGSMRVRASLGSLSFTLLQSAPVEPVLTVEIAGFGARYEKADEATVDVRLRTFRAYDARPSTAHFAHRQLFGPSVDEAGDEEGAESDAAAAALDGDRSLVAATVRQTDSALDVEAVLDRFTACVIIPLILRTISTALDIKDAALSLLPAGAPPGAAGAVQELETPAQEGSEAFPAPAPAPAAQREQQVGGPGTEVEQQQAPPQGSGSATVQLRIRRPRLILLVDAARADSKAIVAQCSCNVMYRSESSSGAESAASATSAASTSSTSSTDVMHVSVTGLRMFVERLGLAYLSLREDEVDAVGAEAMAVEPLVINRILQPLPADVTLRTQRDSGVVFSTALTVVLGTVGLRLSYKDVVLFSGVLSGLSEDAAVERLRVDVAAEPADGDAATVRSSLYSTDASTLGSFSESASVEGGADLAAQPAAFFDAAEEKEDEAEAEEDDGPAPKKAAVVVSASLEWTGLNLALVNDFSGNDLPLLQLRSEEVRGSADGAIGSMSGRVDGAVALDFWHPGLSVWEPVVERWPLQVRADEDVRSTDVSITSDRFLSANLSTSFLNVLTDTATLIMSPSESDREFLDEPLVVRNELGIGVALHVQALETGGLFDGVDTHETFALGVDTASATAPVLLDTLREHLQLTARGLAALQSTLLTDMVTMRVAPLDAEGEGAFDPIGGLTTAHAGKTPYILRSKAGPPGSGPSGSSMATQVVWDVSHEVSGRVLVRLRSAREIRNENAFDVDACAVHEGGLPDQDRCLRIPAKSARGLPLRMLGAARYAVRPVEGGDGAAHGWSAPAALFPDAGGADGGAGGGTAQPQRLVCAVAGAADARGAARQPLYIAAGCAASDVSVTAVLSPTLYVRNLLPCLLHVRIISPAASRSSVQIAAEPGVVTAAAGVDLAGEAPVIQLQFGDMLWSDVVVLPLALEDAHVPMRHREGGRATLLAAARRQGASGALSVDVWAPAWIMDTTGSGLVFSQDRGARVTWPRPHAAGAAGEELLLQAVRSATQRSIRVVVATNGERIFGDRSYAWRNLPPLLLGALQLQLFQDDRHWQARHAEASALLPPGTASGGSSGGGVPDFLASPSGRGEVYVSFTPTAACSVFVCVDARAERPPHWLRSAGFALEEGVEMLEPVRPGMSESRFAVYAKHGVRSGERVRLGPNAPADGGARLMYCAFVQAAAAPQASLASLRRQQEALGSHWARGSSGLLVWAPEMSQAERPTSLSLGPDGARGEANVIYAKLPGPAPAVPFDSSTGGSQTLLVANESLRVPLVARSRLAPGAFGERGTRIVSIAPRLRVVNCLAAPVTLRAAGAARSPARSAPPAEIVVEPGERCAVHIGAAGAAEPEFLIGVDQAWSSGGLRLDKVGTYAVHCVIAPEARRRALAGFAARCERLSAEERIREVEAPWAVGEELVLNAEVRLATEEEGGEMVCILWRGCLVAPPDQPLYALQNETPLRLRVRQKRPPRGAPAPEWVLSPRTATSFGLAYPHGERAVELVSSGGALPLPNMDEVGMEVRIPVSQRARGLIGDTHIACRCEPQGSTKVLRFFAAAARGRADAPRERGALVKVATAQRRSRFVLRCALPGLALGVIADDQRAPYDVRSEGFSGRHGIVLPSGYRARREVLSLMASDLHLELVHCERDARQDLDLRVQALQIDNHADRAAYPVLLCATRDGLPDAAAQADPVLQLVVVQSIAGGGSGGSGAVGGGRRTAARTARHGYRRAVGKLGGAGSGGPWSGGSTGAELANQFVLLRHLAERPVRGGGASSTVVMPYVSFRLLGVEAQLDLRSMLELTAVLAPALRVLSREQADASLAPSRWLGALTSVHLTAEASRLVKAGSPRGASGSVMVNVDDMLAGARRQRVYIQKLWVHPIQVHLSFLKTMDAGEGAGAGAGEGAGGAARDRGSVRRMLLATGTDIVSGLGKNVADLLFSLATVRRAPITLTTFGTDHVMLPLPSLMAMIGEFYSRQLSVQMLLVAGSLSMIGNPVELFTEVGTGVRDLVYEPVNGLMLSPQDAALGVVKGVRGLVRGVVRGTFSSVTGITEGVGKNLALLSADRDYARSREARRHHEQSSGGGVAAGMANAGKGLIGGIVGGVTGLVTKPVSGAKKEGVQGFMKGVGKGLLGAVVKPVVGVTDAATSVFTGIANEVDKRSPVPQKRPRRAIDYDPKRRRQVLRERDLVADRLQLVVERSQLPGGELHYLASLPLSDGMVLILTNKRVFFAHLDTLLRAGERKIGKDRLIMLTYGDISHVTYAENEAAPPARRCIVRVELYAPLGGDGEASLELALTAQSSGEVFGFFRHMEQLVGNQRRMMGADGEAALLEAFQGRDYVGQRPDAQPDDVVRGLAQELAAPALAELRLAADEGDYLRRLNTICNSAVARAAAAMQDRKCHVCVLLNMSELPVRLYRVRREAGVLARVLAGPGCASGGLCELSGRLSCAVFVAFGEPQSAFAGGKYDATLSSSAGTIRIGDAAARTVAQPLNGFLLSWTLKTSTQARKSVLVIS